MAGDNMLHAEVRQTEGLTFVARGPSNHWVVLDTSESGGGHGAGSNPMELLLMALGGCTGMDIVSILAKMKESYMGFRVELSGERAEEHPHRFTRIYVDYYLTSDSVLTDNVAKAIRLSAEKYCSVGGTLVPGVALVHRYHIIRGAGEETGEVV
ncbi:OsmC family protein [Candidatus Cryosericum terrychapinii]|uniref:OsmC family peroxiredoxin n=1 Tax=Candidatus Cryosericum terrychapinii TaxID=2290919 RepID=A0A398CWY3_9BACT|nr:OsmC family protein [Candidatus Cryosericum terrychapinii]RIE06710.1 OsmC family peroxiredoxin [Candidatus Cryosericum terrychapinii]